MEAVYQGSYSSKSYSNYLTSQSARQPFSNPPKNTPPIEKKEEEVIAPPLPTQKQEESSKKIGKYLIVIQENDDDNHTFTIENPSIREDSVIMINIVLPGDDEIYFPEYVIHSLKNGSFDITIRSFEFGKDIWLHYTIC